MNPTNDPKRRLRSTVVVGLAVAAFLGALVSCGRSGPPVAEAGSVPHISTAPVRRQIRLTGVIEAARASTITVPAMYGQSGAATLIWLITNGARVKKGDLLAKFDPTQQLNDSRTTEVGYVYMMRSVDTTKAQNRANSEQRQAVLERAEADRDKAVLELRKGPVLSEISRLENEVKAELAREHVASLEKSIAARNRSDAAILRYQELQRDEQEVAVERWHDSIAKLEFRAPLPGMVALLNQYRNNALRHAQVGDQFSEGQSLMSIFDPSVMLVRCGVAETDVSALVAGARATVYLDAYPDLVLPAHLERAGPVATSTLGSPIKTFTAVFHLDRTDPRVVPDLSAAVVVEPHARPQGRRQ